MYAIISRMPMRQAVGVSAGTEALSGGGLSTIALAKVEEFFEI
jgi:hypothetical protein